MIKKQEPYNLSNQGLNRRAVLKSTVVMLSAPWVARANKASAQEKLTGSGEVVAFSYGGAYTKGIRERVYDPFTKATGIKVIDVVADVAEPQVRAMATAGRIDWDLTLIDRVRYAEFHEASTFMPIDYTLWDDEALEGVPAAARREHAVVAFSSAALLAYNERAFPKGGPKNWADFWDVRAFPGPRGLRSIASDMVLALAADGVPASERWPLTDNKIDRALKKVDEIKPHVAKWWKAGGEPVQALLNGEFVMSSCYDGRAIVAIRQGAPIRIVWDGANRNLTDWAVLKGGPNSGNAQKLLAFINGAQTAAGFTLATNYAGPNVNQLKYLPTDLVPFLGIEPKNASQVVLSDDVWLGSKRPDGKTNRDHIEERWLAWQTR